MPLYEYTAHTPDGRKVAGKLEAGTPSQVADTINGYGFLPLRIQEFKSSWWKDDIFERLETVNHKHILDFTRQLATLLGAGLTLLNSLDTLMAQTSNQKLAGMIKDIRGQIAGGKRFSEALGIYPKYFSSIYRNMIIAGERSGMLVEILKRLTILIQYEAATKAKVLKATRYPSLVLATLSIAILVLVNFVLPNFTQLFSMFGNHLPLPTRMLLRFSHFMSYYHWHLLLVFLIVVVGLRAYIRTEKGRYECDRIFLKVIVLGRLFSQIQLARASRVLAMLNQSGIPILDALSITAQTSGNTVMGKAFLSIREKVRAGEGLSSPIHQNPLFPPVMANMISVGEKSGNLSEMLSKVAEYFEEESEHTIDTLSTLIEPLLIAILACGVLFMALAVFMPMWNMMQVIKT